MGSAASTMPAKLTPSDIGVICADKIRYKDMLVESLKDHNDLIDRDLFIYIMGNEAEKEILSLYLSYCTGHMDKDEFLKLCVDTKMLTKKYFTRKDAEALYLEKKSENTIFNYNCFRFAVLPEMALRQESTPSQLVEKLSTFEPSQVHENGERNIRTDIRQMTAQELKEHNACLKLQKIWRAGLSRRSAANRKVVQRLKSVKLDDVMNKVADIGAPDKKEEESCCFALFTKFSVDGYMSSQDLVNFCMHTELVPFDTYKMDFTRQDAKHIFQKAVALHFNPSTKTYSEGVLFGKRLSYTVFRTVVIPEIADRKVTTVDKLMIYLLEFKQSQSTRSVRVSNKM